MKKRFYILSISFLLLIVMQGKGQIIDSIEQQLKNTEISTEVRIDDLNLLSREYTYIKPIRSIETAKEALELATTAGYEKGRAYAYRNLAGAYSYYGSFYLTIDNLQKALEIFRKLDDAAGVASCSISMGHTYRRLHNRTLELQYHKEAYEIFERLGDMERIGVTAHNLGETYYNIGNLTESKLLTEKAIRINDSLQNLAVLSSCYKVMGNIFFKEQKTGNAEHYYKEVLRIAAILGKNSQKQATVEAMIRLAELYDIKGETSKRLDMLKNAAQFVSENKLSDYVEDVYFNLVEVYIRNNNREKALEMIRMFHDTRDTLNKVQLEDRNRLTMGFIQLFELEKKNTTLAEKNSEQENRIKQRNQVMTGILLFSLLLIVLLMLLVRNYRLLKKTNQKLQEQDKIITRQNKILAELNATKDKFFSVVSHDMKAPINSLWSFTRLLEDSLEEYDKEQLIGLVRQFRQHLESTSKMTENLLAWAKLQMKEMTTIPELVSVNEVAADVCKLYNEIAHTKNISIKNELPPVSQVWADKNQLHFILRNLVNNALKYSSAGGIIRISGEKNISDTLKIKVADNGKGMQETLLSKLFTGEPIHSVEGTAGEQGSGLGLKLCYEFAILNKGVLMAASKPNEGAVFSLVLPVHPD